MSIHRSELSSPRPFIALFAVLSLLSPPAPAQQAAAPPPTTAEISWAHPLDVVELFFPRPLPDGKTTPKQESVPDSARLDLIRILATQNDYKIETLIALVPDPIDSRTAGSFDQAIGALQDAAAAADWLLERHYLPWTVTKRADNKDLAPIRVVVDSETGVVTPRTESGVLGKDFLVTFPAPGTVQPPEKAPGRVQVKQAAAAPPQLSLQRKHETEPGVVLFRLRTEDASAQKKLLVVFLVGETQTWGAQRVPLRKALSWSRSLSQPASIRILGPWFSGTATSLALELAESRLPVDGIPLRVASGTASDPGVAEALPKDSYRPFAPLNSTLLRYASSALARLGIASRQIAFLVENDTSYGRDLAHSFSLNLPTSKVFPLYGRLSGVRSEWSNPELSRKGADAALRDLERVTRLSLEDRGTPTDLIPQVAALSTSSAGTTVSTLVARLRQERIRFVCPALTDVRDRIFIAQVLNRQAPDIRLILLEASSLYVHPDVRSSFDGALVFTGYDITGGPPTENDDLQRPPPSSDAEAGAYQAARHLFDLSSKEGSAQEITITPDGWTHLSKPAEQEPRKRGLKIAMLVLSMVLAGVIVYEILQNGADYRRSLGLPVSEDSAAALPELDNTEYSATLPPVIPPWMLGPLTILTLLAILIGLTGPYDCPFLSLRFTPDGLSGPLMAFVAILIVVAACWGRNRAGKQVTQSLGIEAKPSRLAYVILLAAGVAPLRFLFTEAERIWSFTAARGTILYLCLALAILRIAWCLVRLSEHWEFLKAKLREAVWSGINAEDLKVLKDTIAWSPMSALAGRTPEFSAMNEALQSLDALASTYTSLQTWASPVVSVRTIAITSPAGPARQNLRFSLMRTILEADASFLSGQSGRSPETLWSCPAFRRFEASRMLILARCVFESLRSRLIEILVLMALLSVGVLAFSFTPERAVSLFLVVVAAIIAAVVIHTLREIDRNPFLSWASGGNAWTVEWTKDFFSRIVLFGLGPALLLLATQIPALARILGPFLDTLSAVGK